MKDCHENDTITFKCFRINIVHGDYMKCHKCGCTDKKLIHHHKSYTPEIIVMMCKSCHTKLHRRLRKEDICQVPADELEKLSMNSKHSKNRSNQYQKIMLIN